MIHEPADASSQAMDSDELTRTLVDMIRLPSPNPGGTEAQTAAYVADYCRRLGLEVETPEVVPGRPNVVARLRGAQGGPAVALNSHMDTVPASVGWTDDPFGGVVRDGRVYGLGASDAKGQIAAMLGALKALAGGRAELAGEVVLTAVIDEEVGSLGTRNVVEGLKADYAIIGEPTVMDIGIAHRGSCRPRIAVEGRSAHSSMPHLGMNAIYKMQPIIQALERYAAVVEQRSHPLIGSSCASVTLVSGGQNECAVPDSCEITFDRRMVPGETHDGVVAEIEAILEQARADDPELKVSIVGFQPVSGPPSETPRDARLVGLAVEAVADATGATPEVRGMTYGCDMSHFRRIGAEAVILGPGDIARCHKPDEWVGIDELTAAAKAYTALLRRILAA